MLTGCTIVARNYLAFARVLASSFREHHPGARFVTLVVDAPPGAVDDEPFEVWSLSDLSLDTDEVRTMAGIYSVMEFCTAVKPTLLGALVARNPDAPVVYLDPDIEVYGPLTDVAEPAMDEAMVLTPHVLEPMPRDGRRPNEADILGAGVYNLGFIAVSTGAVASGFLAFWADRLRRDAVADHERMLFTDQRWVDFVAMYPHHTCRDITCNVAYWNVWARPVGRDAAGAWTVAGRPLRFFHFSGFDPFRPHVLSAHQGSEPRIRLPEHRELAELCARYGRRLVDAGHEHTRTTPYAWGATDAGLQITTAMRRAYRSAVVEAEAAGATPPPGPFDDDGGERFADWLTEPVTEGAVSNLLRGRWESEPGLRVNFPEPLGVHADAYAAFAREHRGGGIAPDPLYDRALAEPTAVPHRPVFADRVPVAARGVNLYGYFTSGLSVGRMARNVSRALTAAGVSIDRVSDPAGLGAEEPSTVDASTGSWIHDVNLLCVNADRTAQAVDRLGWFALEGRPTAAHWAWETSELAPEDAEALTLVDEVWAQSTYVAEAIRRAGGTARVVTAPVPVPRWSTRRSRQDLGLPEGFVALCAFDWFSVAERKNPLGVLDAYTRAFGPDEGASLVFKTVNGEHAWADLDALQMAIGDRRDVHVIDGFVSSTDMTAFLQSVDCLVSLHRSEGFGMLLAEAMGAALPCVATAYSGNLDFMDDDIACLVPATTVAVPEDVPVYGGHGEWAEPDVDAAADHLRRLRDDPRTARRIGERARQAMLATRNPIVAGRSYERAADELRVRGVQR